MPLESRVDYLTLSTGQKFALPFMVLVVFATNLKPRDLVDDAGAAVHSSRGALNVLVEISSG